MSDEQKWNQIESAPKDGTSVLGFTCVYAQFKVIQWHAKRGVWIAEDEFDNDGRLEPQYCSHWMPLPEPPK